MEKINGLVLAEMIDLGSKNLAKNAEKINALNVFPVPDGDTGTNMNLSMSSGAKETAANVVENIGELGKSFSKGLLMGARGNSGVILSQLFRGMSQHIADKKEVNAKEFAEAIQNGVSIAYKAIIKPVEGTILTVAREAAEAGLKAAENTTSVVEVMEAIYAEAQASLKRTPELLPILKEVGVVDSGGQGLVCVYQGFVAALKGEKIEGLEAVETNLVDMQFEDDHDMDFMNPEDIVYGFCTEFTVRLDKEKKEFNEDKFREDMSKFGDSLLVISDSEFVKIHVHTETPGDVFNYGQQYGELIKIKSDNMREQHREVLRKQEAKQATAPKELKEQAMISISMGAGLSKVLTSMGVDYIVEGGQTMNPSTEDIMKAIKEVNAKNIFIFPNNKNIQLAAKQAAELAEENVFVVESKTAPQGLAAVMVYNPQAAAEENFANMQEVLSTVSTLEITHAVRDTNIEGVEIKKDEFMGIRNGKIVVSNLSLNTVLEELLEKSLDEDSEIVTLYLGEESTEEYTDFLEQLIEEKYPDVEVELIESGQPVYPYIIGVE
ncbi:DAK2 domain-containing protein [Gemella haemolysans]|uniref:DAK2 domain fusion protein YloV n=1 Tax=Gemella haemolysans ATCC 10379 TaxID=546270 RepID=C5NX21_9BACL|nr:DAK2 domain-containing protein [Gemella haemolysans]EER68357.1 DAK2 domain fusion protein YloV [Gemella haemolysans ATCC 10379]KAA8707426.1 DAK2 domain-containing protein [Gemella haemolysans]UBH81671.1 DAK2 domain-containing protein [Gemella haemolysans]VEI38422.1 dihydroxyacetone kinase [Gemella haemolysans]